MAGVGPRRSIIEIFRAFFVLLQLFWPTSDMPDGHSKASAGLLGDWLIVALWRAVASASKRFVRVAHALLPRAGGARCQGLAKQGGARARDARRK